MASYCSAYERFDKRPTFDVEPYLILEPPPFHCTHKNHKKLYRIVIIILIKKLHTRARVHLIL